MLHFFSDYTVQVVILGTLILGIVSGALGAFAMLRKQSLLGDAISHAALPGICLAFLVTLSKTSWVLLIGAALSGWIGTLMMMVITEYTSLKKDAALGIILSVFFGFGLMLLTFIQRLPTANQAGLNKFLFGSASTLLISDVWTMVFLGVFTLVCLTLFWKEFKLLTFDADFAQVLGFPTQRLHIFLTTLIVISIVIGLQTVGVVLMSAMLIAPAAAARQWTDSLATMVILSAFFGAISGITGSILSSLVARLPTGPMIVLIMSCFVLISILVAPQRGILWELRFFRSRRGSK
jgi:manganese/zinc/iron transport system permease protein